MSNSNKNSVTQNVSTSKFALVRAIARLLNLGDEGKLESFFERVNKTLKKENTLNTKSLENLKFNHEQKMDELKDKLEDANEALSSAYTNVNVALIQTNGQQEQYVDTYLSNIDQYIEVVQSIEKDTKKIQDQIDSNKKRLSVVGELV